MDLGTVFINVMEAHHPQKFYSGRRSAEGAPKHCWFGLQWLVYRYSDRSVPPQKTTRDLPEFNHSPTWLFFMSGWLCEYQLLFNMVMLTNQIVVRGCISPSNIGPAFYLRPPFSTNYLPNLFIPKLFKIQNMTSHFGAHWFSILRSEAPSWDLIRHKPTAPAGASQLSVVSF